jgi:hypothetical protein
MARWGPSISVAVLVLLPFWYAPLSATPAESRAAPPVRLPPLAAGLVQVDRIEGDRAVLVLGKEGTETAAVPVRLLPPGAREGATLDRSLSVVPDAGVAADIDGLLQTLVEPPPAITAP